MQVDQLEESEDAQMLVEGHSVKVRANVMNDGILHF